MWGIAYRVAYPGLAMAGLSLLFVLLVRRSAQKMRDEKRKRTAKYELFLFCLLGVFGLGLSLYYSLDLILRDHVEQTAVCRRISGSESTVMSAEFSAESGEIALGALTEEAQVLKTGEIYRVTYGKRTKMIVRTEKIGN